MITEDKINKIKKLAMDSAATNGERAAAVEALRRLNVPLDIIIPGEISASNSYIIMIPLWMIMPAAICIYAPSRILQPFVISQDELSKIIPRQMLVSLAPDGKSDPQMIKTYNGCLCLIN